MEKFVNIFNMLNIQLTDDKMDKLIGYMTDIIELNQHINLTAITEREEFIQKHYIDSLLCVASDEFINAKDIIDVGTGGGFPGVPLGHRFS